MDAPNSTQPAFSLVECRVLGVLVEKAKTTPDVYPLSLNSLTAGCNQKSNRDPVLSLGEDEVETTLASLQKTGLVTRIQGGRVERWKHNLYEQWNVGKVELAILTELLLRGPQTEGELRGRAGRMEPIADLDALRQTLKPMAERSQVVFLGVPGRRGTLIAHGFHDPRELEGLRARAQGEAGAAETVAAFSVPIERAGAKNELLGEVAALKTDVQQLRADLQALADQVQQLRTSLGS